MPYKQTLKKMAIGAAAGFIALSTLFQAHAKADTVYTPDNDINIQYINNWAPKPGTERYELLKSHEEFIKLMRLKAGYSSCCNLDDAQPDLEEEINTGPDRERYPYIVTITHDLTGKKLDSAQKIKIPADKILTVERAQEILDSIIDLDPEKDPDINPDSTYLSPSFNVLWAYDNTNQRQSGRRLPWEITKIYCYFPKPNLN